MFLSYQQSKASRKHPLIKKVPLLNPSTLTLIIRDFILQLDKNRDEQANATLLIFLGQKTRRALIRVLALCRVDFDEEHENNMPFRRLGLKALM